MVPPSKGLGHFTMTLALTGHTMTPDLFMCMNGYFDNCYTFTPHVPLESCPQPRQGGGQIGL